VWAGVASGWLLGVPLAGLVALGSAWLLDRSRPWETVSWRTDRFVLLSGRLDPAYRGERWVVAVQPDCPHCMATAPVIADSARRLGVRVAALLVDCPRAPDPAHLGSLHVDELWWDAGDTWRGRWGHRIYGELLRFDAAGQLIDPARVPRGVPITRGDAPAPRSEGGENE